MEAQGAPVPDKAELFLLALTTRVEQLMKAVRFGAAAECFDATYWDRPGGKGDVLVLRKGASPSKAIDQLVVYSEMRKNQDEPETAKLDCVEIIEVARWLAQRDVIGVAAFDRLYGGTPFTLDAPGSTGVVGATLAVRIGGADDGDGEYSDAGSTFNGKMTLSAAGKEIGVINLAERLAALPIGSRVMWRNFDPNVPPRDDFKNENTLKIGKDLYAAHPLGIFPIRQMVFEVSKGHYTDMIELVEETRTKLAKARKSLAALKEEAASVKSAPGESDLAKDGEPVASTEAGPDPREVIAAQITRVSKRIRGYRKTLNIYDGIEDLGDYIAAFVRIVETETFVNPCAV